VGHKTLTQSISEAQLPIPVLDSLSWWNLYTKWHVKC